MERDLYDIRESFISGHITAGEAQKLVLLELFIDTKELLVESHAEEIADLEYERERAARIEEERRSQEQFEWERTHPIEVPRDVAEIEVLKALDEVAHWRDNWTSATPWWNRALREGEDPEVVFANRIGYGMTNEVACALVGISPSATHHVSGDRRLVRQLRRLENQGYVVGNYENGKKRGWRITQAGDELLADEEGEDGVNQELSEE